MPEAAGRPRSMTNRPGWRPSVRGRLRDTSDPYTGRSIHHGRRHMSKTYKATLRTVDGFQEVVLPPEIHLENDEYFIRRDEISGNVILSTEPEQHLWKEF